MYKVHKSGATLNSWNNVIRRYLLLLATSYEHSLVVTFSTFLPNKAPGTFMLQLEGKRWDIGVVSGIVLIWWYPPLRALVYQVVTVEQEMKIKHNPFQFSWPAYTWWQALILRLSAFSFGSTPGGVVQTACWQGHLSFCPCCEISWSSLSVLEVNKTPLFLLIRVLRGIILLFPSLDCIIYFDL